MIRLATEADVEALLGVEEEFRRSGVSPWSLLSEATFLRKIRAREVLVADEGSATAGYLCFSYLWGYPWIEYARLHEGHRGRGLGSGLVAALEEQLRAEGHRLLFSSTTEGEERALRWHRKNGFEDAGVIRWQWRAPRELLLHKQL